MTDLKIEKNVPLPDKQGRRKSKYPEHYDLLEKMEVGLNKRFKIKISELDRNFQPLRIVRGKTRRAA